MADKVDRDEIDSFQRVSVKGRKRKLARSEDKNKTGEIQMDTSEIAPKAKRPHLPPVAPGQLKVLVLSPIIIPK